MHLEQPQQHIQALAPHKQLRCLLPAVVFFAFCLLLYCNNLFRETINK